MPSDHYISDDNNNINLTQRTDNTTATIGNDNQPEENDVIISSASIGNLILIGGALVPLATSALFYRRKHKSEL